MKDKAVADQIKAFIDNHIDEELSLDILAENLYYSKFYIARTFVKHMETTIHQYIKEQRLHLAAQKLVETEKPIVEIAFEAHYHSQQAFTLAFKQRYLCTPRVYRKNGILYLKKSGIGRKFRSPWGGRLAA